MNKSCSVSLSSLLCASVFLLVVGVGQLAAAGEVLIVDGDTLDMDGSRIRIEGIDAPEAGQKCGKWDCGTEATAALYALVGRGPVSCDVHDEDGYGRNLATCYVGGKDIGASMVRNGFAWAFVKYSKSYVAEEQAARSERLGIWGHDSLPAWEYRAAKWRVAEQGAPNGCPIKGNISKGGKIYHAPWSPWYKKTTVDESKGERWFCTEAEATAAGWRAPLWK